MNSHVWSGTVQFKCLAQHQRGLCNLCQTLALKLLRQFHCKGRKQVWLFLVCVYCVVLDNSLFPLN